MLIYALYVAVLVLLVVAAWFAWHMLRRGRRPPEVEDGDKGPAPDDRDERWDPRRRYGNRSEAPDNPSRRGG